jgi:hypothetical protein
MEHHADVTEATSSADALLRVVRLREEIDRVAETMIPPNRVFGDVSLPLPTLQPAELGFIRSVAYMYVLYFEAGEVAVPYLSGLWEGFSLDGSGVIQAHRSRVARLRTYLQHNLNPTSTTDQATRLTCENWFVERCGTSVPSSEDEWSACLDSVLAEAGAFLGTLLQCLRAIERDEGRNAILEAWLFRISRYHPPEAFDEIVGEAAADIGRIHLDIVRFRKRFYDQWMERLSFLTGDYDFREEARRLVESALLVDVAAGMPITGTDIIHELDIAPGPAVGAALALARRLFESEPTDRAGLLARVRENLAEQSSPPAAGR